MSRRGAAHLHISTFKQLLKGHAYFILGLIPVFFWCVPYFFTGQKMELGDFSFFSQCYEAVRISIIEFGQFPWWNPWISGGVPLYANPQVGVFSIHTPLVLLFGASYGLKISIVIFTFLGYISMYYLLRKYYKVESIYSALLSLIWIFCSFFVAHLPGHVTFVWYMVAPIYIYYSLTTKDWKSGIVLGVLFALLALGQIHNPFVHISLICGVIILFRICFNKNINGSRVKLLYGLIVASGVFIVLAGHRILLTLQNLHDFPRNISDNTGPLYATLAGFILPYSPDDTLPFVWYPKPPLVQHGFGEVTGTLGIFTLFTVIMALIFCYYVYSKGLSLAKLKRPFILFTCAVLCFLIALGEFSIFAPYSIMKNFPVLSDMRVSTRWFIWADFFLLIFLGLVTKLATRKSFMRLTFLVLLSVGVLELFILNVGYQYSMFTHEPTTGNYRKDLPFQQQSYFGSVKKTTTGEPVNDAKKPQQYREYDSTAYNIGVLYANDALVQIHLANKESPRCGLDKDCGYILSSNAKIVFWSPNRIVLNRTAPGDIIINSNRSSYMLINGHRQVDIKTAEPFSIFRVSDSRRVISIDIKPSLKQSVKNLGKPKPNPDYN